MRDEDKHPADITRREALKKIGKYGLYVPPTLAVLTAAPRAFAASCMATLRGIVYTRGGTPIAGAAVTVHCDPILSTTSQSNGEYLITGIPPGSWRLEYSAPGYQTYEVTLPFEECVEIMANPILHPIESDR